MIYKKHIFVCTNQRPFGARICCGEEHGSALVAEFKKLIRNKGLDVEMRAQRTGCFDICEKGPTVAIYPEGVFYGKVQLSDVEEIVFEHLENDRIVNRLLVTED
ncbi:ferredoxin [Daejeonella sp.]|uniref:(2Fe-2S) ferredoxin domain-containing protein n=1 Tax=Daejeonella sp. TaxID=2805397 RepID=UPI0027307CF5|nr:(2Fe-2S) ferredoxin domain-containing protein [Daejeonella sp.]MDP2412429.1 (2Fe-2S) ferredoxin domain-containing protein [Daejeonella sp.]